MEGHCDGTRREELQTLINNMKVAYYGKIKVCVCVCVCVCERERELFKGGKVTLLNTFEMIAVH